MTLNSFPFQEAGIISLPRLFLTVGNKQIQNLTKKQIKIVGVFPILSGFFTF